MRRFHLAAALYAVGLMLAAAPAAPLPKQDGAAVSVAPMMVILDTGGRPGSFDVINFSARTATFRLDPLYALIDDEGVQRFEEPAGQPGSAAPFLRWAPRQFEVQPGATRSIRLSARAPADLPPGEYRLHLRVTNIGAAPERPVATDEPAIGVNIRIQIAQAVRILVRHRVGPGTARLEAASLQTAETGQRLSFTLVNNREGGSVLGRYAIVSAAPGGAERLLRETDVTLYPDTDRRPVVMDMAPADLPPGSRACVRFWNSRGGRAGSPQEACVSPAAPASS